ncbi:hypothetical protein GV794_19360 [Nocardia cyriacigeorgica]|uniref:Uncharacterized protein n=1 Tax=Nocardia cyriacigeorgica TaxID=135487 RepID=A0A6P1DCD6_9NOCA|nr:hypothetical protein [Nocardia cyriacigeorgica]NEW42338.1 hypothetical protein [Nocardia cyriacigeorgica]NEW46042.1 hypothetical protein [Nocardia cyriacigeorgica]NEW53235.1 hypothetical protein [Nocardia cyriacigeorgica]NEW57798.1 hypothetical protein [Nocardia cyriacigeorgica]
MSTVVTEKRAIEAAARAMIAGCGAAAPTFDIDLDLGRVIDPGDARLL